MKTRNKTGAEILAGFCDSGRILIFVDDSGTPQKPLPKLAGDYALMCGICMESEKYKAVKKELRAVLNELGIDEFHAKNIVYPGSSQWRKVRPQRKREDIISLLTDVVEKNVEKILFC